jgi:hypothetical protein
MVYFLKLKHRPSISQDLNIQLSLKIHYNLWEMVWNFEIIILKLVKGYFKIYNK